MAFRTFAWWARVNVIDTGARILPRNSDTGPVRARGSVRRVAIVNSVARNGARRLIGGHGDELTLLTVHSIMVVSLSH